MYFLNINKPKGLSSFDVIRFLRKRLSIKQIGHSGTLDPLASGVLQVAVGSSTKLLDYLPSDKTYIADIKFGYVTETLDSESEPIYVKKPEFNKSILTDVLISFLGKSFQIPPKYSAIKVDGKKLCDIARSKEEFNIEIKSREIEIYSIELLDFDEINYTAKIKTSVKKGAYIRSLVRDIGEKLSCGAYMTDLVRIQAGKFSINCSNNLDDENYNKISPIEALDITKKELDDSEYCKIINGNFIDYNNEMDIDEILLTKNNKLVSIAKVSDNLIKPKKVFKEEK